MANTNTLILNLKGKWFQAIKRGKTAEYREIKPHWQQRLLDKEGYPRTFDSVEFRNGYQPNAPKLTVEFLGIRIGKPEPSWCEPEMCNKNHFIIEFQKIK